MAEDKKDVNPNQPSLEPDLPPEADFVIQSAVEAAHLPEHERTQHREIVDQLIGDLASQGAMDLEEREELMRLFDENMSIARGESPEKESQRKRSSIKLDPNKIEWIKGAEEIEVPLTHYGEGDKGFWLGSLIDKSRATQNAYESLEKQGVSEQLMSQLTNYGISVFLEDLKKGGGSLRPISRGSRSKSNVTAEQALDTEYPAYKINAQGTNNRAILLIGDKVDGEFTVLLVALYDHADQDKVQKALYVRTK